MQLRQKVFSIKSICTFQIACTLLKYQIQLGFIMFLVVRSSKSLKYIVYSSTRNIKYLNIRKQKKPSKIFQNLINKDACDMIALHVMASIRKPILYRVAAFIQTSEHYPVMKVKSHSKPPRDLSQWKARRTQANSFFVPKKLIACESRYRSFSSGKVPVRTWISTWISLKKREEVMTRNQILVSLWQRVGGVTFWSWYCFVP